jgi:dipeptidyl aminopeptidase/acylaminoacyl peptidase
MKNSLLILLILLWIIPVNAQKRAMTTDDILNMTNPGAALISPDGSFVIYGKSELKWEDNKRETTYYYIPADSGKSYQYIGKEGGSDLKFSPDGKFISLKRSVDDKQQLFLLPTRGGEALQLTEHKSSVSSYTWSSDSEKIYFRADVPRGPEEEKKYKAGYDQLFVDEPPHGQTEGSWNHIWVIDIDTKEETQLTKEKHIIGGFDVSQDMKRIVYTARFENRRNQQYKSELFLFIPADSSVVKLTDNEVPEGNVNWLPDNTHIVYSAADDDEWELRQNKLWKMDVNDKSYEMISGNFEGTISSTFIKPDGETIYFTGVEKTNTNLYSLNVENRAVRRHTNKKGSLSVFDFDKNRSRFLYRFEDVTTPPDFYVADLNNINEETRLTEFNPSIQDSLQLAGFDIIKWNSYDGLEIEGMLYHPEVHSANASAPLLLHIHGGPAGVFRNSFSPRYHVWAGLGYVQLAPNVRGSTAYGDDFLRGNMRDIGGGDYEDLMSGVDMMVAENQVDSTKMAVRGWSYGGILGGTVVTKTDRFKAASLGAMVSDWSSEYALGFNHDVRLWYIGGEPWTNPEGYRQRSPATYADKVTTPTLFLHGANDRVDTPEQSLIFFTYLKDIGKADTRYIKFKREGHGFSEPRNQRIRDIEEIKWIHKYITGEEWTPWERKEKEEEEE